MVVHVLAGHWLKSSSWTERQLKERCMVQCLTHDHDCISVSPIAWAMGPRNAKWNYNVWKLGFVHNIPCVCHWYIVELPENYWRIKNAETNGILCVRIETKVYFFRWHKQRLVLGSRLNSSKKPFDLAISKWVKVFLKYFLRRFYEYIHLFLFSIECMLL